MHTLIPCALCFWNSFFLSSTSSNHNHLFFPFPSSPSSSSSPLLFAFVQSSFSHPYLLLLLWFLPFPPSFLPCRARYRFSCWYVFFFFRDFLYVLSLLTLPPFGYAPSHFYTLKPHFLPLSLLLSSVVGTFNFKHKKKCFTMGITSKLFRATSYLYRRNFVRVVEEENCWKIAVTCQFYRTLHTRWIQHSLNQ